MASAFCHSSSASASFYSNLEKRLAGKTDAKSRKLLADGYFQLSELTAKIGDQKEALAVQRKAKITRRERSCALTTCRLRISSH